MLSRRSMLLTRGFALAASGGSMAAAMTVFATGAAILTGFDLKLEAAFIDAMANWPAAFATRL
jgi:hypothetical protein